LKNANRLDLDDEPAFGTNVVPLGMTREELRDGYIPLMRDLYEPESYFDRFQNLYLTREFNFSKTRSAYWRRHKWKKWQAKSFDALRATGLFVRLMKNVPNPELRHIYLRQMMTMLRRRPDPGVLMICALKCAIHYHHYTMYRQMSEGQRLVNSF
jgi:hypothetical protein